MLSVYETLNKKSGKLPVGRIKKYYYSIMLKQLFIWTASHDSGKAFTDT